MKENTLSPVWDELWRVKNVPHGAILTVEVMDKDSNSLTDGYIGQFTLEPSSGEKDIRIEDRVLKRNRGTFSLKVCLLRTSNPMPQLNGALADRPHPLNGRRGMQPPISV